MSYYEGIIKGLQEVIDYQKGKRSLRKSSLYISNPEHFSGKDIRRIRNSTHLSQSAFAAAMGVSKKTIEAWEAGTSNPNGPAKRMLLLLEEDPLYFDKVGIVERDDPHYSSINEPDTYSIVAKSIIIPAYNSANNATLFGDVRMAKNG